MKKVIKILKSFKMINISASLLSLVFVVCSILFSSINFLNVGNLLVREAENKKINYIELKKDNSFKYEEVRGIENEINNNLIISQTSINVLGFNFEENLREKNINDAYLPIVLSASSLKDKDFTIIGNLPEEGEVLLSSEYFEIFKDNGFIDLNRTIYDEPKSFIKYEDFIDSCVFKDGYSLKISGFFVFDEIKMPAIFQKAIFLNIDDINTLTSSLSTKPFKDGYAFKEYIPNFIFPSYLENIGNDSKVYLFNNDLNFNNQNYFLLNHELYASYLSNEEKEYIIPKEFVFNSNENLKLKTSIQNLVSNVDDYAYQYISTKEANNFFSTISLTYAQSIFIKDYCLQNKLDISSLSLEDKIKIFKEYLISIYNDPFFNDSRVKQYYNELTTYMKEMFDYLKKEYSNEFVTPTLTLLNRQNNTQLKFEFNGLYFIDNSATLTILPPQVGEEVLLNPNNNINSIYIFLNNKNDDLSNELDYLYNQKLFDYVQNSKVFNISIITNRNIKIVLLILLPIFLVLNLLVNLIFNLINRKKIESIMEKLGVTKEDIVKSLLCYTFIIFALSCLISLLISYYLLRPILFISNLFVNISFIELLISLVGSILITFLNFLVVYTFIKLNKSNNKTTIK